MRPLPIANPPNPWSKTEVEFLGEPPDAQLDIYEEHGKTILTSNDSPDLGFKWSLNPYRGCVHACAYCYARPSHQYWGFGAGTDFDRKIIVKVDAPKMLEEAFQKKTWKGELVLFSGNTDCYQPLEATYELTRKCLEVCLAFKNPIGVITKSALIRRDVALLAELGKHANARVTMSIPFAHDEMARAIEPYASSPTSRFETLRRLCEAGIRCSVNVAPVIPGLNESDVAEILERARDAGAQRAALIPVRLANEVLPVFLERLTATYPDRVGKVTRAIQEMRGGKMYRSGFGERMTGLGPRWAMTEKLFESTAARLGLATWATSEGFEDDGPSPFRRPSAQASLF